MEELLNNLRMQNTFVFMTYIKHRSHNVLQEKKKKKTIDRTGRKKYLQ